MVPAALKDLTQGIITVFDADATLHLEVKAWAFGEPVQETTFPIVWVQMMRGQSPWKTGNTMEEGIWYEVMVKVRNPNRDDAEKKVMDLFDRIKRVQKDDPSFGGLFRTSRLSSYEAVRSRTTDSAIASIRAELMVSRNYV
jgi:hypothetical protein